MSVIAEKRVGISSPNKEGFVSRKIVEDILKAKASEGNIHYTGFLYTSPEVKHNGIKTEHGAVAYVAPAEPTYSPEVLNAFMESLVPQEVLSPNSVVVAATMNNGDLRFGVLSFEQILQRTSVDTEQTRDANITVDEHLIFFSKAQEEEVKSLGIARENRHTSLYRDDVQKTHVVVVPDAALLDELEALVKLKEYIDKIEKSKSPTGEDIIKKIVRTMGFPPTADRLVRYAYLEAARIPR